LVQFRRVAIEGYLSLGKIPLARRPMMSVSWFSVEGEGCVSIPLPAGQGTASRAWGGQAAEASVAADEAAETFACFGIMPKKLSPSLAVFKSR
jgi:hypothetical protein